MSTGGEFFDPSGVGARQRHGRQAGPAATACTTHELIHFDGVACLLGRMEAVVERLQRIE